MTPSNIAGRSTAGSGKTRGPHSGATKRNSSAAVFYDDQLPGGSGTHESACEVGGVPAPVRRDSETVGVVLGWPNLKEILMKYKEEGKGVNMCKALEELQASARAEGEKIGIECGIEQRNCDVIRSMQEEGIELEKICRISGKTVEEVQEILSKKTNL